MAFNSNDLYTLSGGVTIFNYWNPFVTKHDTSSFYNWEQDNLPLYDLEERTYYLWEKFGYPLSAVPGMALLVSSTIPNQLATSSNVFTSVSAAIESLPEIIRMPTLIEVAVSGDIGPLDLNNIKCEEDGALEIINRAFAPLAEWSDMSGTDPCSATTYESTNADTVNFTPDTVSATGAINYFYNSSAVAFSANTADIFPVSGGAPVPTGFTRFLGFPTGQCRTGGVTPSKSTYAYAGVGETTPFQSLYNIYISPIVGDQFPGAGVTGQLDSTIDTLDVSTISPIDGVLIRQQPKNAEQIINGVLTANKLSRIRVENSDGPIYVRGFIVDGYDTDTTAYETSVGIGVYNSNNVSIEDCGAMRCTMAGYEINNSKVKLRRRNLAVRNYEIATRGLNDTYGFKISNSEVEYKTDPNYAIGTAACLGSWFHTYGIHLTNSKLYGGELANLNLTGTATVIVGTMKDLTPLTIGYNNYGLYADSSEYDIKGLTDIYNNEVNIKAKGSEIRTGRFMIENAAEEGLDFSNSRFILNTDFERVIRSTNSTIYNSSDYLPFSRLGMFNKNRRHLWLKEGSYYGPDYPVDLSSYQIGVGALADAYSLLEYNLTFGYNDITNLSPIPSISINNSRAVMPASLIRTVGGTINTAFTKGNAIQVNDGGVCKLIGYGENVDDPGVGSKTGVTNIIGAPGFGTQPKTSALAATNNSTIYITGPTGISQYGIGILADNNSVIKACPVLGEDDSSLDGSGWGRMELSVNTSLDIHSTRACVIASNNSQIRFEDLGFFRNFWPDSTTSSSDYNPHGFTASGVLSSLCQAGALQFYPNPMDVNLAIGTLGGASPGTDFNNHYIPVVWPEAYAYDVSLSCNRVLYSNAYSTADTASEFRAGATRGGVCVRATGDSEIFVRNVHFPTGQYNADGSFFDPSASIAGCNDLQIWNVQDTSRLNASYATVSGSYPSLIGYTGPRSFYASSIIEPDLMNDSSAVGYAAFSGTPDTGTLSVLDHYGSGVAVSSAYSADRGVEQKTISIARTGDVDTYGPSSYENRGPFRLYFPTNPEAKVLSYAGAGSYDTRPYQHLAQGYALSGSVSAVESLSSVFPNLLNIINDTIDDHTPPATCTTSGYYWPDSAHIGLSGAGQTGFSLVGGYRSHAMLPNNSNAQVLLDESFSNTFSNAKHCNTNYSGRRRLVSIYKASTSQHGESFVGDTSSFGMGFTSTNIFDVEREM